MSDKGKPDASSELTDTDKRRLEKEYGISHDQDDTDGNIVSDDDSDDEVETHEADDNNIEGAEVVDDDELVKAAEKAHASDSRESNADRSAGKPGRFKRFFKGYWRHKAWTVPVTLLVLIIGAAFGLPWSRYLILGQYIERSYSVELIDAKTLKPISGAALSIDGWQAVTDAKGQVTLRAKVGPRNLEIDKRYYKTYTKYIFVGLGKQKGADQIQLVATGRQVPIMVTDKITGKPLSNATVKSVGTEVKTDKDGKAVIVLPADKPNLSGTVSFKGYNDLNISIQVTESAVKENSFAIVPAGKVYFLSRLSGKIDVVKTDLDGSNRQTVIAGTGKEDENNTVLLASRDWKYLALLSKRDSSPPKLYLIDTATDKMTTMDEGDATFALSGWSGHNFVYNVTRSNVKEWEPNRQAVKSYDAEKHQLLTVDQSAAEGGQGDYSMQYLENFTLVRDKLVYTTRWVHYSYYYSPNNLSGKSLTIREVSVGTTTKKDLKSLPADQYFYISATPYSPTEVYFQLSSQKPTPEYLEYDDGKIEDVSDADVQKFQNNQDYHTYLVSPSGSKTFWSEQRDGRDTFFVGDAAGNNAKQVAVLDEYQVYGWYSDDYLLVSKKGSELFIMPAAGGTPLKVTDYHKPQVSYRGYGGGYGGL